MPSGGWLNSRTFGMTAIFHSNSEWSYLKTLVWSAFVYGAVAWTLCRAHENRIMAAEMWFWRHLIKTSWKEKRTNASVLNELGVKTELLRKIMTLKIGYLDHILRGSGCPLTLQIIEGMIDGKRRRGRQKKQWFDNIREWSGMSYTQAKHLAQNRKAWRNQTKRCADVVANRQMWWRQQGSKVYSWGAPT